jgi:tetratricopeptide (TPR) repeat protein
MDKSKSNEPKNGKTGSQPAATNPPASAVKGVPASTAPDKGAKPVVPGVPTKVAPMFRLVDWLTLAITFGIIWIIYLCTLAPEQTLEDSGELCTGAFYAGIPHPPGYPFWSVYAWFWTAILPFGNVAWRVEVGESFAAAMGCGLLALMVSRGSSMLIEGIEAIRNLPRRWENSICAVSGIAAGTLLGLDAFMWSESVVINRISLFGVPWLIAVLACLMRWMYAPQQRRYLYLAMFLYGLCATIHQTLLLSAMGIEVAIALASPRLGRDMFFCNSAIFLVSLMLMGTIPALHQMSSIEKQLFYLVGLGSLVATAWLAIETKGLLSEWLAVVLMGLAWVVGVCVYFYEPISCMTDPPMQWGYPRTVEGFFHALSRGQYETATSYNVFSDPKHFLFQLGYIAQGLTESFSLVYVFIGLLPFAYLLKMHRRERSWIIGLTSIYFCLSVLLVVLINVSADRQSTDLNKVFFTASHGLFAMMIGYGLALLGAYTATNYQKVRMWGLALGAIAVILAISSLKDVAGTLYRGPAGVISLSELPHYVARAFDSAQYALPIFANLILLAIPLCLIAAFIVYRQRGPVLIMLALFCLMPTWSGLTHWYKSEQHNHWFGFWFGHDMFTPPFTDPKTGQLTYDNDLRAQLLKNPANAKTIYPEMDRNTILYGGTDPGRFCPTYSIFCDSFIPHSCQPKQDQKFDRRDCYLITQNALADGTYLDYLRAQYNRSKQIDPPFFSRLFRYTAGLLHVGPPGSVVLEGPEMGGGDTGNALVEGVCRLLNATLDDWFTAWGAHVEKYRRARGVYPSAEIYIASEEDSQKCFQDYYQDVVHRAQIGQLHPGETPPDPVNGRITIGGQYEVMAVNGLICKVIFDHNPTNSFYVEESLAIDWMYPYETPFGIIMKINRTPQPELSDDVFRLDHEFWTKYSKRLCGDWITYDTTVQQIAEFVERTYIQNNYQGYKGDRAFVRDDDAQKAFSKLRSSQAGMYSWRCALPGSSPLCPQEYRQKTAASQAALIRETDFAFKQAFAFCPYSPEAVFRYISFLVGLAQDEEMNGHVDKAAKCFDDAILVGETCQKLDPFNDQISGLVNNVKGYRTRIVEHSHDFQQAADQIRGMESMAQTNPANVQNLVALGLAYQQMQQPDRSVQLFDLALARPEINASEVQALAQAFAQMGDLAKCQAAIEKLVSLAPNQPEPRYDLGALKAVTGRPNEALQDLKIAFEQSDRRLAADPKARDLREAARTDNRLESLRSLPEFQKLVPPK